MLVQLKFKNDVIPGYFIDENGKIYDSAGVEQEQHLNVRYYYFKNHLVHNMMAHSFFEYKEGFDVHHLNQIKTDNRLENLCYLSSSEHQRLHKIGNKYALGKKRSEQTKQKMSEAKNKKKKQVYCIQLNKIFAGVKIAAKELSLHHGNICSCCKGKLKTTGGYHFMYYE